MKKRIIPLLLCLALAGSLTGCGGETRESAQAVTEKAIKAVQQMDMDAVQTYWGDEGFDAPADGADEQTEALLKAITSGLTYTVTKAEEDEKAGTATVTVAFTNVDMAQVMADFMSEMITDAFTTAFLPEDQQPTEEELQEKYMDKLTELLNRADNETVTHTVDISLTLVDGKWELESTDTVADAMFGGLYSYAESMGSAFGN